MYFTNMNSSIYLGGMMDTTVISNGPRKSTVSRPPMPTEEDLGKYFKKLFFSVLGTYADLEYL